MNRGELRSAMMTLRSRDVPASDTTTIAKMNTLVDLAYKRLASECPAAILPDTEHCVLLPTYDTKSTGAKIAPTSDQWVMEFVGTPVPTFAALDGTWDGIYHLEVTDSKGQVHRRQCREFWYATDMLDVITNSYVSLVTPWPVAVTGNMTFRLVAAEFFTKDDVMEVLDGSIYDPTRGVMIPLSEGYIHFTGRNEIQGDTTGRPDNLYRTRHYQLDAPNKAPTAVLNTQDGAAWSGEGTGKFDYCFTYVWGRRDDALRDPSGTNDPQWESSPSPISSTVTVPNTTSDVTLTLPTVDWQILFDIPATLRQTHSGLRKRIYRRRYTVTGGGGLVTNIEAPEVFQFLAEVDGSSTTYTDDGSVIPGYYRRLPEVHGYYAWRSTPLQDARYEVDLRVLRRPRSLLNDYDAPRVQPDCIDALLQWCIYYFDLNDNNPDGARSALKEAMDSTATCRARYASPSTYIEAIAWDGNPYTRQHWIGRARA